MNTLDFRSWFEDMNNNDSRDAVNAIENDPTLSVASKKAQVAATDAVNKGENPIKAAQKAILQSNVPTNKLGQVMPKDRTVMKMKKKMKKK